MAKRIERSETQPATPAERDAYWLAHFQAIEAEGIQMREYAEREGLRIHTVYAAKKRLVKRGVWPRTRSEPKFSRVRVTEAGSGSLGCRLRIGDHAILEWDESPSVELLSALVRQVMAS